MLMQRLLAQLVKEMTQLGGGVTLCLKRPDGCHWSKRVSVLEPHARPRGCTIRWTTVNCNVTLFSEKKSSGSEAQTERSVSLSVSGKHVHSLPA